MGEYLSVKMQTHRISYNEQQKIPHRRSIIEIRSFWWQMAIKKMGFTAKIVFDIFAIQRLSTLPLHSYNVNWATLLFSSHIRSQSCRTYLIWAPSQTCKKITSQPWSQAQKNWSWHYQFRTNFLIQFSLQWISRKAGKEFVYERKYLFPNLSVSSAR